MESAAMSIELGQHVRMRNRGGPWSRGFVVSTDPLLVDVTRNGLGLIWEEVEPTFDPHHGPEATRREIFGRLGQGSRSLSVPPALMDATAGVRNVSAASVPAPACAIKSEPTTETSRAISYSESQLDAAFEVGFDNAMVSFGPPPMDGDRYRLAVEDRMYRLQAWVSRGRPM